MFHDDLSDDEIPKLFELMCNTEEELRLFIDNSYNELLFLGTSPTKLGERLLEATLVNMRICLFYYTTHEEYEKAGILDNLYKYLLRGNNGIEIDVDLLNGMEFCMN